MSKYVSNIPSGLQHPLSRLSPDIVVGSCVSVAGRKGVVKYIGTTQFAEGEWYGVCLDNAKGKNDGSVNGVRYFETDADHGLFVKRAQVRLEGAAISAPTRRTTIGIAQTRLPASSTGCSTDDKEEEEKMEHSSSTLASPSVAPMFPRIASINHSACIENENQELFESKTATVVGNMSFDSYVEQEPSEGNVQDNLKRLCGAKQPHIEAESKTLTRVQEKLLAKKEAAGLQADQVQTAAQLQGAARAVSVREKTTSADFPCITPTLISKTGDHHILPRSLPDVNDEVMDEASEMQKGLVDDMKAATKKLATTQLEESHKGNAVDTKNELEGVAEELKRQLREANKVQLCLKEKLRIAVEEKGRENVTNLAKEQATLASSTHQIENLETQLSESMDAFEALTLGKEELELENETLAEEIDQLKEELAGCQLDLEHAKLSAEEAKETTEQQPQFSSDLTMKNMVEVNEKLREALKRLHQISTHDKSELAKLNRSFLKETQVRSTLEEELIKLHKWKQDKEAELVALTEQVDQGTVLQTMVESLSDKCMSFEGLNDELLAQVSDLECSLELSEEIEERQAEELRAMRKEVRSAEMAQLQWRKEVEALQTDVHNERLLCDRLKVAAEELRCGMSELQSKLENKCNELMAMKQRIKVLIADKCILASEAEVSRRGTLLVAMSNLETAEAHALSSRLRTLLPRGMTVLEVEDIVLSSEILAARVAGKCLIACGMMQRLILSWLQLQLERGNERDNVYNGSDITFLKTKREAEVMNLLVQLRYMALKSLLENVNGGHFNEWGIDSDSDYSAVTHSCNISDMQRCDQHLDELLILLEKEGGLFSPDVFNLSAKSLEDIVSSSSSRPPVMGSYSSNTNVDIDQLLQCELSLSSVQYTVTCLALSEDTEERKNKCSVLHGIYQGLVHLREKLYYPSIAGERGLTTTVTTVTTGGDSARWLHDLQHLKSNIYDSTAISTVGSIVEQLCLTIPEGLVISEANLSLTGVYKLIEKGIHRSPEANAVRVVLEKGIQKDKQVEVLQKELQAANAILEERNKALQSAMSQRFVLESLLASRSSEPEERMELAAASLQCERDELLSEKKQFLEAIEMLQQQNGDLETKLLQYQEESKVKDGNGGLSVMRAGTGGQQHCTAERLGMGEEHFYSSSYLPTSMQGDLDFNTSEVEALKRALKQARATAETSCMNTAANLVTALPPLYIIEGWLDDDTLGKQRRRQQPPVLPETYNTTRERIRSLKQLEGQVYELRSTPRVIRLGEGAQKTVEEYQSHNAMALKLYSELKRVRLQMKAGGDRVVFSDSDISKTSTTNPLAITSSTTTKPKCVARLSIGNNSKQNSSTTVTIPVVMGLSGLEQMSKSLMVPVPVPSQNYLQ